MKILAIYLLIGAVLSILMIVIPPYVPEGSEAPEEFEFDIVDVIVAITLWPIILIEAIIKVVRDGNDDVTLGGNY